MRRIADTWEGLKADLIDDSDFVDGLTPNAAKLYRQLVRESVGYRSTFVAFDSVNDVVAGAGILRQKYPDAFRELLGYGMVECPESDGKYTDDTVIFSVPIISEKWKNIVWRASRQHRRILSGKVRRERDPIQNYLGMAVIESFSDELRKATVEAIIARQERALVEEGVSRIVTSPAPGEAPSPLGVSRIVTSPTPAVENPQQKGMSRIVTSPPRSGSGSGSDREGGSDRSVPSNEELEQRFKALTGEMYKRWQRAIGRDPGFMLKVVTVGEAKKTDGELRTPGKWVNWAISNQKLFLKINTPKAKPASAVPSQANAATSEYEQQRRVKLARDGDL